MRKETQIIDTKGERNTIKKYSWDVLEKILTEMYLKDTNSLNRKRIKVWNLQEKGLYLIKHH